MAMLNNQMVAVLDAAQIHHVENDQTGETSFFAKRVKNGLALTN